MRNCLSNPPKKKMGLSAEFTAGNATVKEGKASAAAPATVEAEADSAEIDTKKFKNAPYGAFLNNP